MKHRNVLLLLENIAYQRLSGIARYAREHDWHMTLGGLADTPCGRTCDGILVTLPDNRPRMLSFIRNARKHRIPIVDNSICHPKLRLHRVIGDNVAIGRLAAEHFRERRFENVAFFSWASSHVVDLRVDGFARAWGGKPAQWIWQKEVKRSDFGNHRALRAWLSARLKAMPRPLAVFAYNDLDAARVLDACQSAGLSVPEEVAILGVDDFQVIAENQPVPLSSVQHNIERTGYEGAALLDRLMDGERLPLTPVLIPPVGIAERRSTQTLAVSDKTVRYALALINANIANAYGVDQLASDLGIRPHVLRALFAKHLGTTPGREFSRIRMAKARLLLGNTSLSVKAIAAELGFCNIGYFSNVFTGFTGLSPRAYRSSRTLGN